MARWLAFLFGLGALFAGMSLALPPDSQASRDDIVGAAVASGATTLVLWARAPRLSRSAVLLLALVGGLATTASIYLAVDPRSVASRLQLTRPHWLMIVASFMVAGIVVGRLVEQLRGRVAELAELSRTDPLTGLWNRRAWDEELPRALARARRDGQAVCVAILDLDHFKAYNDMRGHQEGDRLLSVAAQGWLATVRDSDFLARYGGEEFAAVLRNCSLEDAVAIAERMRLAVPDEQTCSAGIARWDGLETPETLVNRADDALYEAKMAGRNRIKVAALPGEAPPRAMASHWNSIVRELLDERSVIAAYQPIASLQDGVVVAYEALARPNASRADISVERMFVAAQRMGLGRDLDWLCRRAALQGAHWIAPGLPLFINVSVSALLDPVHGVDQMLLVLESAGRDPGDVVLEITEREVVSDLNRLRLVLSAYRREGFRFAVDDVGEGHSTLEVLAAASPEFIKLARSLVVAAGTTGPRAAIRAVIAFASETDAAVIAEGIEHVPTAILMSELGVHLAQGYYFGRPALYPGCATGTAHTAPRLASPARRGAGVGRSVTPTPPQPLPAPRPAAAAARAESAHAWAASAVASPWPLP